MYCAIAPISHIICISIGSICVITIVCITAISISISISIIIIISIGIGIAIGLSNIGWIGNRIGQINISIKCGC